MTKHALTVTIAGLYVNAQIYAASKLSGPALYWAKKSMEMNFDEGDEAAGFDHS